MFFYAELNGQNVCIGVKSVAGKIDLANHIEISKVDADLLYRQYQNGNWGEKSMAPASNEPSIESRIAAVEETINAMLGL